MNDCSEFHIDVLGTGFTVVWGAGVTGAHRQTMAAAWSRYLAAPRPWTRTETKVHSLGMPFTATIYFDSKKVDGGVKHVGHSTFEGLAESLTSEIMIAAILEKVAIRHDGVVAPDPKLLSVKQTTADSAKPQMGPDELSLKAAPANLRIRSTVLLESL